MQIQTLHTSYYSPTKDNQPIQTQNLLDLIRHVDDREVEDEKRANRKLRSDTKMAMYVNTLSNQQDKGFSSWKPNKALTLENLLIYKTCFRNLLKRKQVIQFSQY